MISQAPSRPAAKPCRLRCRAALALFAVTLLAGSPARATIDSSVQMELGNPSGATADSTNHSHYLIQRTVESLDFSDSLGEPNWASWDLTSTDIGSSGRSSTFYTDTTLPSGFYEVTTDDYTNSGYDRGHMCPSDDRTDTTADNKLVFYMSNIIPQTADNNEGVWESFEDYCRTQASNGNEVLLICGPSNFTGSTIPSGKAAISGYNWKIAVVVPAGSGTAASRVTSSTRVIAVKIPNISGVRSDPWTNYVTSANQIQADTGFTFFTSLSASVATALRAKVDSSSTAPTPVPAISSFSPASGPVGISVVLTGSGLTNASAVKFNDTAASTFTVNSDTQLTATVPTGATTGTIAVTTPGGTAVSANSFTVSAAASGGLVISQVYGGGGNSGATYTNDFIELYNASSATINLSTYAVQYASATGTSWSATNLSGTVAAGHYYLVQEASGGTTVKALPTPEATGTTNLSSSSGKVALTNTQTLLTTSNPVGSSAVVDFVGYGTANAYEGSGDAPTLTASTADQRASGKDTNDNSADFTAVTPNPHD